MKYFTIAILLLSLAACGKSGDVVPEKQKAGMEISADEAYKKEMEEIRKSLKSDIKIKLKKDAKGGYSWEINGKNVQEVLKANDALRKRLSD